MTMAQRLAVAAVLGLAMSVPVSVSVVLSGSASGLSAGRVEAAPAASAAGDAGAGNGADIVPPAQAGAARKPAPAAAVDPLIAGFAKSTVASVADAVDQIVGTRGYLAYDMRPYVAGAFVGRAATALVKAAAPDKATPALAVKHSVEMIDAAQPGDVGVIVMEGSLDVAAIGGLMGTAAKSRGMAGMVLDGAVRDIKELRDIDLPVFARSASPGTAVSRYASVSQQVPVQCAGVTITPGDIVVAGEDGVVIVPKARAADVLQRAQEIDERETKMVPFIKQYKSLQKAIEVFNRI